MNDLRQASEQVLEAWDGGDIEWFKRVYTVMENLRAALAQQAEPVEPVAWAYMGIKQDGTEHGPHLVWKPEYMDAMSASKGAKATPLYTASPRYTLSELVKRMQPGDMPADKEWDAAPPVGREEGSAK